jgi:hypothetical protein
MLPLLIALLVFLAVGIAGTRLLRRQPPPSNDLMRGLDHLASLRWRELARLVMQAMQARGYVEVRDTSADTAPAQGTDILLERQGALTLLSCKYGNAAVVGAPAILGLAKSAELRGAQGVIVVTPGRFDDEARRLVDGQPLELVDGADLWREVRPFVPVDAQQPTSASAPTPLQRALPWLAGLILAGVAWMLLQGMGNDTPVAADAIAPSPPAAQAPAARANPASTTAVAREPVAVPATPAATTTATDPTSLTRRRKETADAISTLPGVDRAVWSTQSTLLVYLAAANADPLPALCPLLLRYEELAPSRLQLQPPAGSDAPVRFRQCRSY